MVLIVFKRVFRLSIKVAVSSSTALTSSIIEVVRASRWDSTLAMVACTLVTELKAEVTAEVAEVGPGAADVDIADVDTAGVEAGADAVVKQTADVSER